MYATTVVKSGNMIEDIRRVIVRKSVPKPWYKSNPLSWFCYECRNQTFVTWYLEVLEDGEWRKAGDHYVFL